MRLGHEWCRHGRRGRRRRRPGLGRPAGHGRHDARRRRLPPLPTRPPARLRAPAGGRHPRRPARRAGRAAGGAGALAAPAARRRSTPCSARWSSRAATPCARSAAAGARARRPAARPGPGHDRPAGRACSPARPGPRCTCWAAPARRSSSPAGSASSTSGPRRRCPDCRSTRWWTPPTPPTCPARRWTWSSRAGGSSTSDCPGRPSLIDTRTLALKDVTAVGILSASPGLDATIAAYAAGAVDPRPLVAATVGLDQVGAVLSGERPPGAGAGPKIHIDPRAGR